MKSKNSLFSLIFTIINNCAIALLFIIGFVMMFSAKLPDKIDKNYFTKYMEEKGCHVTNLQEKREYPGMTDYLITNKETCPYLISYSTFNNRDVLLNFFSKWKKDVIYNNTNVTGKNSVSINLFFEYYEYNTSGDYYKAIVYNDNSVLYASADKQYREDVRNIFKDLNYQYEISFKGMKIVGYSLYVLLFISIISMWGTLRKTRNKGWISLIPFYNIGCLSKDVLGSAWWSLLLFVPIVNVVFIFTLFYNMAKVFNKNDSYCVLMMLIPSVLWPLLAFDNSEYDSSKLRKETKKKGKKKLTIDEYIDIGRTDIMVYVCITIILLIISLYIGIKHNFYYHIIFIGTLMILRIAERIGTLLTLVKIKRYLIDNNLLDKIGNIDYWNNRYYFLTDNYMIIKQNKEIYSFEYSEIERIYKESYVELGKHSYSQELLHIIVNGNDFKILISTTALVGEDYRDISGYLIEKNPKIIIDTTDNNKK